MLDAMLSWPDWDCTALPADGAEVRALNGVPPTDELAVAEERGVLQALFCRQGGLCLELADGRRLAVNAGEVLFLPGRVGAFRCRFVQEPFQAIIVQEDEGSALASLCALGHGPMQPLPEEDHGCSVIKIGLWCEAFFVALDQLPKEHRGNFCALKVLELLYLFHAQGADVFQPTASGYYDRRRLQTVQKIHDYMLEHLDRQLTIRQMSRQFLISETLLKACFRQIYGAPIHQYFLERRMARAAHLLCSTDQTVLQIALAVGYGSVSQFGAAFKARYHMPPSQFRKKNVCFRLPLTESE